MLKKKELLTIFVLALLVTGVSGVFGKGWPLAYLFVGVGAAGGLGTGALIIDFDKFHFTLNLLFWFLILVMSFFLFKRLRKRGEGNV